MSVPATHVLHIDETRAVEPLARAHLRRSDPTPR